MAPGACISPDPTVLPTALLYGHQHSHAPAALLLTLRTLCVMSEVGKILNFCRFLQVQRAHTKPGSCVPISPHQLNTTQSSAHPVPRPFPGGKGWTGGARQRQESAKQPQQGAPFSLVQSRSPRRKLLLFSTSASLIKDNCSSRNHPGLFTRPQRGAAAAQTALQRACWTAPSSQHGDQSKPWRWRRR